MFTTIDHDGVPKMGKKVAITGVTSYFALTLLPKLQADPESLLGLCNCHRHLRAPVIEHPGRPRSLRLNRPGRHC